MVNKEIIVYLPRDESLERGFDGGPSSTPIQLILIQDPAFRISVFNSGFRTELFGL